VKLKSRLAHKKRESKFTQKNPLSLALSCPDKGLISQFKDLILATGTQLLVLIGQSALSQKRSKF
jgi:hypothetical protein